MTVEIERVAERMFNAYNAQGPNPWKTFDGRDVPRWPELGDQVRAKWIAAASEGVNVLQTSQANMLADCVARG